MNMNMKFNNETIREAVNEWLLNDESAEKKYGHISKVIYLHENGITIVAKPGAYVADFAWGLKKLNSFHEKNVKRHLETLLKNGFKIY
jgi:hypothetical protein